MKARLVVETVSVKGTSLWHVELVPEGGNVSGALSMPMVRDLRGMLSMYVEGDGRFAFGPGRVFEMTLVEAPHSTSGRES
jgi:hypothetical protein